MSECLYCVTDNYNAMSDLLLKYGLIGTSVGEVVTLWRYLVVGSLATDEHAFLVARHSKNLAVLWIYLWFPIILLCSPPALAHAGTAGAAKCRPLGVASMQTPQNSLQAVGKSHGCCWIYMMQ